MQRVTKFFSSFVKFKITFCNVYQFQKENKNCRAMCQE